MSRPAGGGERGPIVRLIDQRNHLVLDNGIVQVTISKPGGIVTCLQYGGLDNVFEVLNKETNRGYRQYGLWERYSELYPDADLVYTVGVSDWRRDWFFAHACRIKEDGTLQPTTWQVKFQLDKLIHTGVYKFWLALAASSNAAIQVRFNDPNIYRPHFDTMQTGKDNAIARHGIHGLYHLFSVDVSPELLCEGQNVLYLTQRKATSCFTGVMYDYLRFEEPPH